MKAKLNKTEIKKLLKKTFSNIKTIQIKEDHIEIEFDNNLKLKKEQWRKSEFYVPTNRNYNQKFIINTQLQKEQKVYWIILQ